MIIEPVLKFASTVSLSPTTTSSNTAITAGASRLVVTNYGSDVVFVSFADSSATAATTDLPVLPNSQIIISCTVTAASVAARTATAASGVTVYFTPCYGN